MRILITGGTGTIGRRLIPHLLNHNHDLAILSRRPIRPPFLPTPVDYLRWDGKTANGWGQHVNNFDAIINLAGAGIADRRWTDERKKALLNSRLDAGRAVLEAVRAADHKPAVVIQASGIDYYGSRLDDEIFTEASPPGSTFLADVCVQWEAATAPVTEWGVRHVAIRTGIVLDTEGGALPQMTLPFKFLVGGPVGSGQQWYSWIHWGDEVDAIRFLIENEQASGPFNLTSPNPLQNQDFVKAIGQAMRRPALMPAPAFALKLLFGEMAKLVLKGHRVLPARLQELGYQFKFATAEAALRDLLE